MPYGKKEPIDVRFWRSVRKTDGCWEWTAALKTTGYGYVWDGKKMSSAHRTSWIMANGPVPDGLCVLHRCDNRICVRPSHLFLGTYADNNSDRASKGRSNPPKGEAHFRAKLTTEDVVSIRALSLTGLSHSRLADRFGVSKSTIGHLLTGRIWRCVDGR